ncbi:MAG TPA: SulP family inorganic anion transporter, partial [Roseiarcus sp.]|nr:SulP family inorganic anion transporter [Roseiarcus sp.]
MSEVRAAAKPWPLFRGFAGWRPADLGADVIAGLTLAAIAIPEQMATARLGGLPPQIGFLAIIAGAVGFAIFGANRALSVGADSTIAPIFAGGLALVASAGSPQYVALTAMLALIVGALVAAGGAFRLGWIADLLSIPVTTGFLAGIAGHIILSQAPAVLGLPAPEGSFFDKLHALGAGLGAANFFTLAIGLGVLAVMLIGERLNPRIPSALIALAAATILVAIFGLEGRGVATIGLVAAATPTLQAPDVGLDDVLKIAQLAAIVSLVVMVQSAATTRAFISDPDHGPDVNRDFIGVGAASVLAGLIGAFPLNASPPRTAVVVETGGRSQLSSIIAAAIALALALFGASLLAHAPYAALAGVLLFVAQRIIRVSTFIAVFRQSLAEFALIVATMFAILVFPIQQGVGLGIVLSLLHGVWTTTRARPVEFVRIPDTSIWWPMGGAREGERAPGALVVGFQAPLSFLNAYDFDATLRALVNARDVKLLVIEAANIVEVDFTAAQTLAAAIRRFHKQGLEVAIARLESTRA